ITKLVEKINKFIIRKGFEGNLTNFVNNISWNEVYFSRVPYYWARECKKSGFDTSKWLIEPNPNPSE
ncbi:hypothetical protein LCGC14_2845530, partial [marine sediment metagenome]